MFWGKKKKKSKYLRFNEFGKPTIYNLNNVECVELKGKNITLYYNNKSCILYLTTEERSKELFEQISELFED